MRVFLKRMGVGENVSIIDLGGQPMIWRSIDVPLKITILNLPGIVRLAPQSHHQIDYFEGDACDVAGHKDGSFDVVFSNSVIEHVGDRMARASFAREVQRGKVNRLDSQDQDALNIVFEGQTLLLDPSWNTSQYENPSTLSGRVVHLIGSAKPWHARYLYRPEDPDLNRRMYDSFYAVLDRTEYGGFRPWNPMGLGILAETIKRNIPTADMVVGKLRRTFLRATKPS